jgi:2',3'-cyclic-nucleotide 2'-phosphodiesterase/3'-nucleotidase
VDLVAVALHQGFEEDLATGIHTPSDLPNENAALTIARQVPGIDVMLLGHTHRDLPSLSVNGVLLTQADSWGRRLARADIYLEKDETNVRWRVVAKSARTIPVDTVTPDEELSRIAEPYDGEAKAFLSRVIGESRAELTAADARFQDSAIMDLIQRVQIEAGNADVSMAAPFNLRARIPKGPVTVRDIAGLYIYDNTLVVLEVTGQQLKDALEHSARFFLPYVAGKKASELVDSRIPTFNFDIAEGIDYDLDVARPVGQRIQNIRFHGQPLTMNQKLKLAVNNYRVNGGGGYVMYKNAPILFRSSEEIRDMIVEWVEKHKEIPANPTNNWRLLPN